MSHGMDEINIIMVYEEEGKKCPLGNHLSGHFKNRGLKLQNCTLPDISRADSPKRRGSWGGESEGRRTTISLSKIASGENGIRAGSSLGTDRITGQHWGEVA